jgi:putative transposase
MSTPKHRTAVGSSYFVTTKCWQGRHVFQVPQIAEILVQTMLHYRDRNAYSLHEFVVMPDHIHLLLTPSATTSLEKAVQLVKGGSAHEIHKQCAQGMKIWQEGFYDWTIRNANDWQTKVAYIRMNPVRAKLAAGSEDWLYSSANQRFQLDPVPARYTPSASGAKAPVAPVNTPGLKPRPPKELQPCPPEALEPQVSEPQAQESRPLKAETA